MSTNTPFRILTVCTGNICRSPMAERLLQTGFDEMAPGEFTVASAGTGALLGSGIPYRRSEDVYQQMVHQLIPAVDTLLSRERKHR
ncbi:arsenate reductase/protein-tyrosine-phosphatase family protein [Arthrobacter sp. Z1-15]